ncbi:MAG: hypothetical protein LBR27_04520 [Bifidobacteriaceae bacterium]|jgi:hypothetical protein|nr:hypothetical protein [Bifidobacteriaceae bacterium]
MSLDSVAAWTLNWPEPGTAIQAGAVRQDAPTAARPGPDTGAPLSGPETAQADYEYVGLPPLVAAGAGCGITVGATTVLTCLAVCPALPALAGTSLGFWMVITAIGGGATLLSGIALCRGLRWAGLSGIVGALVWLIGLFASESQLASITDVLGGLDSADQLTHWNAGDIIGSLIVAASYTLLILAARSRAAKARGVALEEFRRHHGRTMSAGPARVRLRPGSVTAAAVLIILMGAGLALMAIIVLVGRGRVYPTWAVDVTMLLCATMGIALIVLGIGLLHGADWAGGTATVTMIYLVASAISSLFTAFTVGVFLIALVPAVALSLVLGQAGRLWFYESPRPSDRYPYRDLMATQSR